MTKRIEKSYFGSFLKKKLLYTDAVNINNGVVYLYSLVKPYSSQEFAQLYSDIEID